MIRYAIPLIRTLACALVVCATAPLQAAPFRESESGAISARAESEVMGDNAGPQSHRIRLRNALPLRETAIMLERPTAARLAEAKPAAKPGPLQIGISRAVPGARNSAETGSLLIWNETPEGGRIAALKITSPDALGLRMGVLINKLPASATLRFYASGSSTAIEVSAQTLLDIVASNRKAGDTSDEGRTYWSPVIEGSETVMELEVPPGQDLQGVEIALPRVSHLFAPVHSTVKSDSSSCNLDATCFAGSWDNESRAVAKISFVESGSSYLCSGTLVNDKDTSTTIPYFLSANHCISSQTVASTLTSYWLYHSSFCNSGTVFSGYQTLPGGAALLYANAGTDTSFMQLNSNPPAGVLFAGWDSNMPSLSAMVTGIHHPHGDLQKISFGALTAYENCTADGGGTGSYSCSDASANSADHYSVVWSSGITEGGSSGSGLFLGDTHSLIGTLHGGQSFCSTPTAPDDYGSFSRAFNAALYQWLNKTNLIVARAGTGFGEISSNPAGISCGSDCGESYTNSASVVLSALPVPGSYFSGWSGDCSGTGVCALTMSSSHSVTATFNPIAAPGAPLITGINRGSGSATIYFTPPASDGGSPVTGYTASCSAAGKTTRTASGNGSPITVTGLVAGLSYACSVMASNSSGTGAASASTSVIPAARVITPILMLLLSD